MLVVLCCFSAAAARAVIYSVTDLGALADLLGNTDATVCSVNASAKSVGITASSGNYVSFIYGSSRTNLGTLGGGMCQAQFINNSSVVCGKSSTATGYEHAFKWTPGGTGGVAGNPQMVDLGTIGGGNFSAAIDINAVGQMAGYTTTDSTDGTYHACRFNLNGTITDVGALMPVTVAQSFGYGINQAGQIVGAAQDDNGVWQAFYYNNTNLIMLGDLTPLAGNLGSEAYAISAGQVVGYATVNGGTFESHAFRWKLGVMTDLGTLGGADSSAWSINSNGVVVGTSSLDAGNTIYHAFIAASNTMVDLNTQLDSSSNGWVLVKAECINDAGIICGYGTYNGSMRGFMLMPPATGIGPVITNQPASISVLAGSNATFSVTAGGTAPLGYQWRFNVSSNISGARNSSFTVTNAQASSAGNYSVVITNLYGSITSAAAYLNVVRAPQISSINVTGANVILGFTTSTGATYAVQNRTNLLSGSWVNTLTNISGISGTKSVTHTNGAGQPARFYRVRVSVP